MRLVALILLTACARDFNYRVEVVPPLTAAHAAEVRGAYAEWMACSPKIKSQGPRVITVRVETKLGAVASMNGSDMLVRADVPPLVPAPSGYSFGHTAAHELGHLLIGPQHSADPKAVMFWDGAWHGVTASDCAEFRRAHGN